MFRNQSRVQFLLRACQYPTILISLFIFSSDIVRAQQPQPSPSAQIIRDSRRAEMESRQRALRDLEQMAHTPDGRPTEERLQLFEIKNDFEMLQVTAFLLSDSMGSGPMPDYGHIKKEAAEVKKRAARLKTNLALPKAEKDERQKNGEVLSTAEKLKVAIGELESLVRRFASNPVFQQPGVVDARDSAKARGDLEAIIRQSELIQKAADALSKVDGKGL